LPEAFTVNLLPPETTLRYEREPSLFRAEVLAQPRARWIVIDEVQRVPKLLDEVHFLMEEHGYKRFVLTGSSARKLKRGSANLLAGRAVLKRLYPLGLVSARSGSLPARRRRLCVRCRNRVDSQPTHAAASTDVMLAEPEAALTSATPGAPGGSRGSAPLAPSTEEGG
jgi:hypothetical protein